MDKLTELVGKDYSTMTYAMSTSTSAATEQLASLNEEKTAIEGFLSTLTTEISAYLVEKAEEIGGILYSFGSFGTQNIGEWVIYKTTEIEITNLVYTSTNSFTCSGEDKTSDFEAGTNILCDCGEDGYIICGVISSIYTTDTLVTVSGGEPTANLSEVFSTTTYTPGYKFLDNSTVRDTVTYVNALRFTASNSHSIPVGLVVETDTGTVRIIEDNGAGSYDVSPSILSSTISYVGIPEGEEWDDDVSISGWIDKFDFAYDHLYHPLGSTGTYGIVDKIAALSSGMKMMDANKTKQDLMDSMYRGHTTWEALEEVPVYDGENAFYYPGDMTSTFTSGSSLLIDCGVDGARGSDILSSEYIPASATSYTECVIVPYIQGYSSSLPVSANILFTDDLVSIEVAGGSEITGIEYENSVTFNCIGDQTSSLTAGTILICTFEEELTTRYFTVSGSFLEENEHADYTLVKLTNGLPITQNITTINTST